jgi:hypothetical protein
VHDEPAYTPTPKRAPYRQPAAPPPAERSAPITIGSEPLRDQLDRKFGIKRA